MVSVKLFVILINLVNNYCSCLNYCSICTNHTICLYQSAGASRKCYGYDTDALLSYEDKLAIIDKINERRNFVASGDTKRVTLPQAANMKKIIWSSRLAMIAQRWADQCDSSIHPDRADMCRDLPHMKIGQNIASVLGPAPGLHVKSMIDTWFMQSLDYTGSVTYYNSSMDHKTDYFTQLIWSETYAVGCGKVKFNLQTGDNTESIVRLVCNFAPRGNIYGKPLYAIGYPATQCEQGWGPDVKYKALCTRTNGIRNKQDRETTSFLRILNLFNNTVTQEIDPIQQVWRNISNPRKRKQRIRHVYNKTNGIHHLHEEESYVTRNPQFVTDANRRVNDHHFLERGHSRLFHGSQTLQEADEKDYDARRHRVELKCTRKADVDQNVHRCTRHHCIDDDPCVVTQNNPCNTQQSCQCLTSSACPLQITNYNCGDTKRCPQCGTLKIIFPTTGCYNCRKTFMNSFRKNAPESYQYYDLLPNVDLRSGPSQQENPSNKRLDSSIKEDYEFRPSKHLVQSGIVKKLISYTENTYNNPDYDIHSKRYKRKKRKDNEDNASTKPFWQVDDITKAPMQLKALRYTTLSGQKSRMTKRKTDSIAVNLAKEINHQHPVKEKYLSFEELMNLRRNNDNIDTRRKQKLALREETQTTVPTVTASTFSRVKHCTRQLTCTWTAPTASGSGGRIISSGSKTPPGYVEGCTRTSTCTRDFMERNKMPLPSEESNLESATEDEDYCEKKSLNVKRDSIEIEDQTIGSDFNLEAYPDQDIATTFSPIVETQIVDISDTVQENKEHDNGCICDSDKYKTKRSLGEIHRNVADAKRSTFENVTYGNLFYTVLNKILRDWRFQTTQKKKCLCNDSVFTEGCNILLGFVMFINLFLF